jgi:hypothetical protein
VIIRDVVCSSWTNKLITAKDHASIQINIGHLDEHGVYDRTHATFALRGKVRANVCSLFVRASISRAYSFFGTLAAFMKSQFSNVAITLQRWYFLNLREPENSIFRMHLLPFYLGHRHRSLVVAMPNCDFVINNSCVFAGEKMVLLFPSSLEYVENCGAECVSTFEGSLLLCRVKPIQRWT